MCVPCEDAVEDDSDNENVETSMEDVTNDNSTSAFDDPSIDQVNPQIKPTLINAASEILTYVVEGARAHDFDATFASLPTAPPIKPKSLNLNLRYVDLMRGGQTNR